MAEPSNRQLVIFTIADHRYALPIERVQEIIRYTAPRPVDADDSWVRGVISLRGRIVRVHDVAVHLSLPSHDTGAHSVIIIVEVDGDVVGVLADAVEEVLTVEVADIEAVPAAENGAFHSIAKVGEDLVVIVDPSVIFAADSSVSAVGAVAGPSAPSPAPKELL